jgi:translocation protein SEC62
VSIHASDIADRLGKTAVKALLSPAYGKVKKAPAVKDEKEAAELLAKVIPL